MTLEELKIILKSTGYPVTYSHFKPSEKKPIPSPPYICYLEGESNNFYADNTVLQEASNIRIELYTVKKDLVAEGKVKGALKANQINYETDGSYIESQNLFMRIFEVELR